MLVTAGHEVVGSTATSTAAPRSGDPAALPNLATICKDIRDVEVEDLRGIEAVVHLAALSNDPLGDLGNGCPDRSGIGPRGG